MTSKSTLDDLKTIRDEIRVKVHLGGLEAKAWWEEIEPQFMAIEQSLSKGVDKATTSANLIAEEFTAAFRRIRERMDEPKK